MSENIIINTKCGKKLEYREMNPGEILDFILSCGGDGARNEMYLNAAQTWCSVRAIDGIPLPFPRNREGIKDLANNLGIDGINAIEEYISSETARDSDNQMEEIKN
ncbi:hypothetical protein [Acetobacter fallax]|uniref:Phage protein n=1 Tax=Acetobacter fallax TaxID=1737473 RepID=A0ABX0KCW5_9PROT|nr:hypothetical protein [Acetobacter fallax]NHO34255.1 hypothetical protein [Acetobacter fallax]NHO37804.1 hypothetical protein [Acetobacter fallax]